MDDSDATLGHQGASVAGAEFEGGVPTDGLNDE